MRAALLIGTLTALALASPTGAVAEDAATYDLIFKTGTLDDVEPDRRLVYRRDVTIAADKEYAARNTGVVHLSLEAEEMARLRFEQSEKDRIVGSFPASVGNPIILYFVETVLRDVAKQAGGSPFYIRNRIKDSLLDVEPIRDVSAAYDGAELPAQAITLHPFRDDPNQAKMRGFGDLTLTFTMSGEAPGWYLSLVAEAGAADGAPPVYRNALTLSSEGAAE